MQGNKGEREWIRDTGKKCFRDNQNFFLKNISPNGSQLEIDDLLKILPGLRKALILQWTKFLAFIGSINKMIPVPIHNQIRFLNYKVF